MKHTGSCHCGKVKFEIEGDLSNAITCNCSICHRKGTVFSFVSADKFNLISGKNDVTDYQFGKKSLHHPFCSTCGITTYGTGSGPDGKQMYAVNLRCVNGMDLAKVKTQFYDGKSLQFKLDRAFKAVFIFLILQFFSV